MIIALQEQMAALIEAQEEEEAEAEGDKDSKISGGEDVPRAQKLRSNRRRVKGHRVVRPLSKIHETDEENEDEEDDEGGNAGGEETEDDGNGHQKEGNVDVSDTDDDDVRQVMDALDQQMKILEHFKEFQTLQHQQIIMDERQDEEKKRGKKSAATTGKGIENSPARGGKKKSTKGPSSDGKKKASKKTSDQPIPNDSDGAELDTGTEDERPPSVGEFVELTEEEVANEEMEKRRQELLSTIQQIEKEGNELIQLADQVDQLILNQPTNAAATTTAEAPKNSNKLSTELPVNIVSSVEPSQSTATTTTAPTAGLAADEISKTKIEAVENESPIERLNEKRRQTQIVSIEDYLKSIESDDVSYDQVLDEILSSVEYLSQSVDGLDEETNQTLSQINTRIVISRDGGDSQPSSGVPTAAGKSRKGSKSGKKSKRSSLGSIASTATSNTATTEQMILGTLIGVKDHSSSGKKASSGKKTGKVKSMDSQEENVIGSGKKVGLELSDLNDVPIKNLSNKVVTSQGRIVNYFFIFKF
jgi:hypothetical protein